MRKHFRLGISQFLWHFCIIGVIWDERRLSMCWQDHRSRRSTSWSLIYQNSGTFLGPHDEKPQFTLPMSALGRATLKCDQSCDFWIDFELMFILMFHLSMEPLLTGNCYGRGLGQGFKGPLKHGWTDWAWIDHMPYCTPEQQGLILTCKSIDGGYNTVGGLLYRFYFLSGLDVKLSCDRFRFGGILIRARTLYLLYLLFLSNHI